MKIWAALSILLMLNSSALASLSVGYFQNHSLTSGSEKADDYLSVNFLKQISEALVNEGRYGDLNPGLARVWRISEDMRRITFELYPNKKFSDGSPLVAQDVKTSLEKIIFSDVNPIRFSLASVEGCSETTRACTGIVAKDKNTLEIKLKEKNVEFVRTLSSGLTSITKKSTANKLVIGTGPYKVVEKNKKFYFEPNDFFLGKRLAKKKFEILLLNGDSNIRKHIMSKRPDIGLMIVNSSLYPETTHKIINLPVSSSNYFFLNPNSKGLKLKKDRATVARALSEFSKEYDQQASGKPLHDYYPTGVVGHTSKNKALQEMISTASTCPSKKKLKVTYLGKNPAFERDLSEFFEKRCGLFVQFEGIIPPGTFIKARASRADIFLMGWMSMFPGSFPSLVPVIELELLAEDQQFQILKSKALSYTSREEQESIYRKISTELAEQALFVPRFQDQSRIAIRKGLEFERTYYRFAIQLNEVEGEVE